MYLLAVDDLDLSTLSLPRLPLITDDSDALNWQTRRQDTATGSALIAAVRDTAQLVCLVFCNSTLDRDALIAQLSIGMTEPRRLRAQRLDEAHTVVEIDAAILKMTLRTETDFIVTFEADDSIWRELSDVESVKVFSSEPDRVMSVTVPGNTSVYPKIVLIPTAQRTVKTGFAGWQYRTRWTIQNTGSLPWYRYPVRIDFGSTTALVSGGKMQSNGRDVRVILDGIEQQRTLVDWNTASSYLWVVVPNIPPGGSLTYDIVYGNNQSGAQPILEYPNLPAIVLDGSTNSSWDYPFPDDLTSLSSGDSQGLWALSSYVHQGIPDYSVPGAWHPVRTRRNPDAKFVSYAAPYMLQGSDEIMAYIALALAHPDNIGAGGTQSIAASLINGYDGIAFYSPLPITAVSFEGLLQNDNGVGQIVALGRESSAQDWYLGSSVTTTHTNTSVSHATGITAFAGAIYHEVAVALWPANGWDIPDSDTPSNDVIRYETDPTETTTQVALSFDDDTMVITKIENEVEVYEWATELSVGGGETMTPPYRSLLVGNARNAAGVGTPRVFCQLDECLVLDCETGTAEVFTFANDIPDTFVERVPAAAVRGLKGWNNDGITAETPTNRWLMLSPRLTPVTNSAFDAGIAGWSAGPTGGGSAAVTWSWDSGVGGVLNGALKAAFSGTTTNGAVVRRLSDQVFPTFNLETVNLAAWVKTDNVNLVPVLGVRFFADEEGVAVLNETRDADWVPVAGTEYERSAAVRVPNNARGYRLMLGVVATASNPTGNVWFDDVRLNGGMVLFRDESIGQIETRIDVRGAWL